MIQWTTCNNQESEGNIFAWSSNFNVSSKNVGYRELGTGLFCLPETLGLTVLSKQSYTEGIISCKYVTLTVVFQHCIPLSTKIYLIFEFN